MQFGAGLAFGAEPLGTTAASGHREAGGAGSIGGPVVLAGQPHDRVGVVLAAGRDGDPGAQGQGRLSVLHGLSSVAAVGVGGDAELGVESVEGLLGASGGGLGLADGLCMRLVAAGGFQIPYGVGLG
jgi:hypothetical protein